MNRRTFLRSLAGVALGCCVGVQRVVGLGREVEPAVDDRPRIYMPRELHEAMMRNICPPQRAWFSMDVPADAWKRHSGPYSHRANMRTPLPRLTPSG